MRFRALTTTMALAAMLIAGAAAQEPEAVANPFLPINIGETVVGFLTPSDDSLQDGSLYKMFLFSGEAGQSVTFSLNSGDFNAHLLLADSVDTILADDADGGGRCNARVTFALPTAGRYIVYATSFTPGEVGEFQLSAQSGTVEPASNRPCSGFFGGNGPLAPGDSVEGTLGPPDSKLGPSYFQVWRLAIPEGLTVTIDLVSGEFDSRLTLYQGYATPVARDDDGGGACNARLVHTGSGHPERMVIMTGKADETGDFLLRVQEGALPVVAESQCQP